MKKNKGIRKPKSSKQSVEGSNGISTGPSVLSAAQLKTILQQLPRPCAVYKMQSVRFEVYRAKDQHVPTWNNAALRRLVMEARKEYWKYGKRPLLDNYDTKAAIYIVRAIYPSLDKEHIQREEWITGRVVPGSGTPRGVCEPEIYTYKGKTLDFLIARKCGVSPEERFDALVSTSRICGVRPYQTTHDGVIHKGIKKQRFQYTAIGFALVYHQYASEYPSQTHGYRCVTGMIRNDLIVRGLTITKGGKSYSPNFTSAHIFLEIPRTDIVLDKEVYAYPYPSYWLDSKCLLKLLHSLLKKRILSQKTIHHYIKAGLDTDTGMQSLGNLLTVRGTLWQSNLTGEDLRALVDKQVPVSPELKLTDPKVWDDSLSNLLQVVGCIRVDGSPVDYR